MYIGEGFLADNPANTKQNPADILLPP